MLTKSGFQSENWIVGTKELKDGGILFSNGSKFFESEWNRHSVSFEVRLALSDAMFGKVID